MDKTRIHTLSLERLISLPPARCFALWSRAEVLEKWWGPKDDAGRNFLSRVLEWVPEPGASWQIQMTAPDGSTYLQGGEMLEVVAPKLLRFSFHWIEAGQRGPATEILVRFEAEGTGTRLIFTQSGFRDGPTRDGHVGGWQECIDRFVAALPEQASA
jgi:uncharacterized protein YndB with AHSA1/START domain